MLKKKFDDIFDSTRYSKHCILSMESLYISNLYPNLYPNLYHIPNSVAKALDAILKTKKEYLSKSKDLKADVMEIGAHMQAADDLKKTLDSCLEKQDNCTRDVEELESRIESVADKVWFIQ